MKILLASLFCFLLTLIIIPLVIKISKNLKIKQTILSYVDNHAGKSGTPTMGGVSFIVSITIIFIIFATNKMNIESYLCIFVMLAFGIIGFLDDFIKVYFKQNKGLGVFQKLISQIIISIIVAFYAYYNTNIGSYVFLPLIKAKINFGIFIIPFNIILILATTNANNLIDGLDGLSSAVTLVYSVFFAIIVALSCLYQSCNTTIISTYNNIFILCGAIFGALFAFLLFNIYPARIFMGDTGSLALGGLISTMAIITHMPFLIPIIGFMYFFTSISVLIQVGYYKKTKKRVFLMAPFHHHLERKGFHEMQIVMMYVAITCFLGILCAIIVIS